MLGEFPWLVDMLGELSLGKGCLFPIFGLSLLTNTYLSIGQCNREGMQ